MGQANYVPPLGKGESGAHTATGAHWGSETLQGSPRGNSTKERNVPY